MLSENGLPIGEEEVEFDLNQMEKYPSYTNHVYSIGIIEKLTREMSRVNLDYDSLDFYSNGVGVQ